MVGPAACRVGVAVEPRRAIAVSPGVAPSPASAPQDAQGASAQCSPEASPSSLGGQLGFRPRDLSWDLIVWVRALALRSPALLTACDSPSRKCFVLTPYPSISLPT